MGISTANSVQALFLLNAQVRRDETVFNQIEKGGQPKVGLETTQALKNSMKFSVIPQSSN
jgi:hypothetical protein